jgi:plastocyanin
LRRRFAQHVFICVVLCILRTAYSPAFATQITVTGRVELSGGTVDASNAVVWLTPLQRSGTLVGSQRVQLVQKHKTFSPHLLVVQVGSKVDFPNKDPFFHNVFSLFEGKRFDLGLYEAGTSRGVHFNRTGVSYIFCNIHPEMSAVVISLETPYYGVSSLTGMVAIADVPFGLYEMRVWHERVLPETLNAMTRTFLVSDQMSSFGTLRLPLERNLTGKHKNKYGRDYDPPSGVTGYPRP